MTKFSVLKQVYAHEQISDKGHPLIDQLKDYLCHQYSAEKPVNQWQKPEDELAYWRGYEYHNFQQFVADILDHSIHIHNPKYMGHQVSAPAPMAILANVVSDLLNNGGAVYEMGQASNALEKLVIELFCNTCGYDKDLANGLMTSGGTLANLTALLAARQAIKDSDIWRNGCQQPLVVLVSSQAHYCIDRAARILGLGEAGVVLVDVNDDFSMNQAALHKCYQSSVNAGFRVLAVVGSACSTATGSYDDLSAIGAFCQANDLWFHVDGAHGGAAMFSQKHKHRLDGIEVADSIIVDTHKMMMTPALSTVLLFKDKQKGSQTFHQKAHYLFADSSIDDQWYNSGLRTFECTKKMMCLQFYVLWQEYGISVFADNVDCLYQLGQTLADMIVQHDNFELALVPQTNIVCFRYLQQDLSPEQLNGLNRQIRQKILEGNHFYIVQTLLNDVVYLRTTVMNPLTEEKHLQALLQHICDSAE